MDIKKGFIAMTLGNPDLVPQVSTKEGKS